MKHYKKELLDSILERVLQLENDVKNLKELKKETNTSKIESLINKTVSCKNGYLELLNEMINNDDEALNYVKTAHVKSVEFVKPFKSKEKDHINGYDDIAFFPKLTLVNSVKTLEKGKPYIYVDTLFNHDNYNNCIIILVFDKIEIKPSGTVIALFTTPNENCLTLEMNKIRDKMFTFDVYDK